MPTAKAGARALQLNLGDVAPPPPPPGGPPLLGFGDVNWRRTAVITLAVGTVLWLLPVKWAYDSATSAVTGFFSGLDEVRAKKAVLEGAAAAAPLPPQPPQPPQEAAPAAVPAAAAAVQGVSAAAPAAPAAAQGVAAAADAAARVPAEAAPSAAAPPPQKGWGLW